MKPGLCQRTFKVRFYFGADPKSYKRSPSWRGYHSPEQRSQIKKSISEYLRFRMELRTVWQIMK